MQSVPVIVTTIHRGVFFGYATDNEIERAFSNDKRICLTDARCAIYWGTTKGLGQLCDTGPTEQSTIGAVIPQLWLNDVTAVFGVSDRAEIKWRETP